jgi:hypothetical protein
MDETLKWVQIAANGGAAVMMLVVWLFTMREGLKNNREAFSQHATLSATLIQLLKDEQEYKITLTGILERMSIQSEVPAKCPLLATGKKFRVEVDQ